MELCKVIGRFFESPSTPPPNRRFRRALHTKSVLKNYLKSAILFLDRGVSHFWHFPLKSQISTEFTQKITTFFTHIFHCNRQFCSWKGGVSHFWQFPLKSKISTGLEQKAKTFFTNIFHWIFDQASSPLKSQISTCFGQKNKTFFKIRKKRDVLRISINRRLPGSWFWS